MKKAKILIIDDEEIVLVSSQQELEASGYHADIASNGEQALAAIKEQQYDVVYLDLIMPGVSSIAVCRAIKRVSPQTEVILVSGHPQEIERYEQDFIAAGGRDEVLRKPLMENELINTTEMIIEEMKEKGGSRDGR